jgi:hypothetical protein
MSCSFRGTAEHHDADRRPAVHCEPNGSPAGVVVPFIDRAEAGRRLAEGLGQLRGADVVVLGLSRRGVPVATEVARALDAPLDVVTPRTCR